MQIFWKQLWRKPLWFGLLAVALVLALTFFSTGLTMWNGVQAQTAYVKDGYVSVAIPAERLGDNELENPIRWETALKSGYVRDTDFRVPLAAVVTDSKCLTTAVLGPLAYDGEFDKMSYLYGVLAVICTDMEVWEFEGMEPIFSYTAQILDIVTMPQSARLTKGQEFRVASFNIRNADGTPPLEVGKTYLVQGPLEDARPVASTVPDYDENGEFQGFEDVITEQFDPGWVEWANGSDWRHKIELHSDSTQRKYSSFEEAMGVIRETKDGEEYLYPAPDAWPRWAEYEGDWRDYMDSAEGRVWREEIVPAYEAITHSATVVGTDNLQSTYVFNTGTNTLLEGRYISYEEYQQGAPVCMVSAAYAQYNDYQVGDILELELYDSPFITRIVPGHYNTGADFQVWPNLVERAPVMPEFDLGVKQNYEIVGIYTGPEFELGTHYFHADTIFLPKKSIPNAQQYERPDLRVMQSLILEKGTEEDFLAYMTQAGYPDYYQCYDQDFSAAAESLTVMEANALRILILGAAALALAVLLTTFLLFRRFAAPARTMRLLGASRKKTFAQMAGAAVLLDGLSVVIATCLAAALYGQATQRLLSAQLQLQPVPLLLSAVAAFALGAATSLVWAACIVKRPLIRKKA